MYENIRKFIAPEVVFGEESSNLVGRFARNFSSRKVFLVTDKIISGLPAFNTITNSLNSADIPFVVYDGVSPNPRDYEVMAGVDSYSKEKCDLLVAFGGGSVMDCAKGIGISYTNSKHISEFEGADRIAIPAPPMICIPTTAGSSADVSQFAIISDSTRKVKMAIVSKSLVPDVALIDPLNTVSMDPYLTACTGLDALTHSIEAYVSTAHSPMTDINAMESIRLISLYLARAVRDGGDREAREKMMLASMFAGFAFSNASLGIVHAMAHALGGLIDEPHGESNAILLPVCINFNFNSAPDRYADIARVLGWDGGGDARDALLSLINRLKNDTNITLGFEEAGMQSESIGTLALNAFNDACLVTNPREASVEDIAEIYRTAM